MRPALLDEILAWLFLAGVAWAGATLDLEPVDAGALCDTDADCALLCPASDDGCDGGPQS